MSFLKKIFHRRPSKTHHSSVERQNSEHFVVNFKKHLQRVRRTTPQLISFLDEYFGDDQIGALGTIAAEKMKLTQSDGEEHSFAMSKAPVSYQICTLPVEMAHAKEWFARRYGGYTQLLEKSWNSPHFQGPGCTVLCHIIYGWTRKKGTWVHMAICPVGKPAPVDTMMVPIEFLTAEERRISNFSEASFHLNLYCFVSFSFLIQHIFNYFIIRLSRI